MCGSDSICNKSKIFLCENFVEICVYKNVVGNDYYIGFCFVYVLVVLFVWL